MEYIRFGELYSIPSANGVSRPSAVRGKGYKMINMGELFANNIIYDMPMERVELSAKEKEKLLVQKNDLLFARQSLVASGAGKCSIIKELCEETTFESHLIRVRLREEKCNPWYYYYLFQLPYNPVKAIVNQCAQAGIRGKELAKIKVSIPDITIQNKITSTLSPYDELIENNNKRIKILEKMAANLYKEWFVRFRFPGYENAEFENGIPKGWERVKLSDLIEFNPSVKKSNHAQYKIIPMSALSNSSLLIDDSMFEKSNRLEGSRSCNGDTLLARITPCLENGKTGFVHGLNNGEVAGGSTEFIVMRAKAISSFLVYFIARDPLFRRFAIASMNGADGRQRVKVEKLKKIQWIKPAGKINAMFDEKCGLMFELIYKLNSENQNLIKQRDLLLPRLMSGKLEV